MPRKTMLETIVGELMRPPKETPPIKAATVRRWMRATDSEVRGATYHLLTEDDCFRRITPPLDPDEVFDWLLKYYEWCLRTNRRGEWADSRFTAASDMVMWFVDMWDEGVDRSYLERIKDLIAGLYVTGSSDFKRGLVDSFLEHLFERKRIMKLFESWKDDPQLAEAYEEAALWVRGGGRSPLTRRRRQKREPAAKKK